MNSSERIKDVDRIWNALLADPVKFFQERNPLEDDLLECKAVVLSEPLYDEILKLSRRPLPRSDRLLHDNLFRAVEAIACMANSGGGIVVFGVASARIDAFQDDGQPIPKKGMKAKEMTDRYFRLERGVRLGSCLVIGLDHEMSEATGSGPIDANVDKYIQRLFGHDSPLWGRHGIETSALHQFNDWYHFVPTDAKDETTYPDMQPILWRHTRWSDALGPHLISGTRLLPIKDEKGGLRHIAVLHVRGVDSPIYYSDIPVDAKNLQPSVFGAKEHLATFVTVPFRFAGQVKRYRLEDSTALQILIERFTKKPLDLSEIFPTEALIPSENARDVDHLRNTTRRCTNDYLEQMERERIYLPDLYVPRLDLETHLNGFIDRKCEKTGMLIVGASGIGKTNTLCHIVGKWRDDAKKLGSDIVLLLGASTLPGGTFSIRDIVLDRLEVPENFGVFLGNLKRFHIESNIQFLLVVDGIDKHSQPSEILRQLDELIGRNEDQPWFKIILSIGVVAYKAIRGTGFVPIVRHYYTTRHKDGMTERESPEIRLQRMRDQELEDAYRGYRKVTGFAPTSPFETLTDDIKNAIRNPLFLRIVMEVFDGRSIPSQILTAEVLLEYCNTKIFSDPKRLFFVNRFVDLLYSNEITAASFDSVSQCSELKEIILDGSPQSTYLQLLDEQVLVEESKQISSILPPKRSIAFAYDRLFDYVLLNRLIEKHGISKEIIAELSEKSKNYMPLRGVLVILLMAKVEGSEFVEVVEALKTGNREVMRSVGVELLLELEQMKPASADLSFKEMQSSNIAGVVKGLLELEEDWAVSLLLDACDEFEKQGYYRRCYFVYAEIIGNIHKVSEKRIAANAFRGFGRIKAVVGELRESLSEFEKALSLYCEESNKAGEQSVYDAMGYVFYELGEMLQAEECFNRSLSLDQELVSTIGDAEAKRGEAESFMNLCLLYHRTGEIDKAISYGEKARERYEKIDDTGNLATAINQIGVLYRRKGLVMESVECHKRALEIHSQRGEIRNSARDLVSLGLAFHIQGCWTDAVSYYSKALNTYDHIGYSIGMAQAHNARGETLRWMGDLAGALDAYGRALEIYEGIESNRGKAMCYSNLGATYLFKGDARIGIEYLKKAQAINEQTLGIKGNPECLAFLSYGALQLGLMGEAAAYSDEAVSILEDRKFSEEDVQLVYYYRYKIYDHMNQTQKAMEALRVAYDDVMRQTMGIRNPEERDNFLKDFPLRRNIVESWLGSQSR